MWQIVSLCTTDKNCHLQMYSALNPLFNELGSTFIVRGCSSSLTLTRGATLRTLHRKSSGIACKQRKALV